MLSFGTLRGRIGYAPGSWLFYATGGFAWAYDQLRLTQTASGATASPFLWRFGWAAGAGVEVPVAPHWTARLEYLFTDYGVSSVTFPATGQRFSSDFSLQELRAGLNYRFGNDAAPANIMVTKAPATPDLDNVNFHGQTTFVWQGYPAFRSAFAGPNSLPSGGEGRETWDVTLYAGVRLWRGAELWIDPEIDQGFGLRGRHGVAGFPSGEAYKLGATYPYARVQRYFVRQTIDLGGETQKVDADINQFAGTQTANRLVLTVGKFTVADIFDTNKYANNPKSDFLNWSLVNAGTFDYAADAWGYQLRRRRRMVPGPLDAARRGLRPVGNARPAGSARSATISTRPSTSSSWSGKSRNDTNYGASPASSRSPAFSAAATRVNSPTRLRSRKRPVMPADINAVRRYVSRPGVSVNLEQQVTETVGVFARAGWADGNVEPWDFTDIDRTASAGVSINGKQWGRPDDTVGVAGVVNGISGVHAAFLNLGGLGILVGDGALPHPGLEQIIETYYSYALTAATKLSFDYQFIANPAYNTDRGPVSVFAGRFHTQF